MEFWTITVGLCFMLNPMISILDILPDFIGCALILYSVGRLAAVSPELDECRPYFKYMMYLSLIRTLTVFGNPGFDDIMRLSLSLLFGAGEFALGLMAVRALYDGIAYLNIRYGGSPKETPEFKYLGILFFGLRAVLSIVPQIGALATDDGDDLISSAQTMTDWTSYSNVLQLVNIALTLICAGFWFATIISYIGALAKDGDFRLAIKTAYDAKRESDPGYFIRRDLTLTLGVFSIGCFFLCDLIGDGRNLIPDFIFPLLALFALAASREHLRGFKKIIVPGAVYAALSACDFFYYDAFMKRRYFASPKFIFENYLTEYLIAVILTLASSVALVWFAYSLLSPLTYAVKRYTVTEYPEEFVRSRQAEEEKVKRAVLLVRAFIGVLILTAASSVAFTAVYLSFPEYRIIHLLINIAAFVLSIVFTSGVTASLKDGNE